MKITASERKATIAEAQRIIDAIEKFRVRIIFDPSGDSWRAVNQMRFEVARDTFLSRQSYMNAKDFRDAFHEAENQGIAKLDTESLRALEELKSENKRLKDGNKAVKDELAEMRDVMKKMFKKCPKCGYSYEDTYGSLSEES